MDRSSASREQYYAAAVDWLRGLLDGGEGDAPPPDETRMEEIAERAREQGVFLPFPALVEASGADRFEAFALLFLFLYECDPTIAPKYALRFDGAASVTLEALRTLHRAVDPDAFRPRHVELSPRIRPLVDVLDSAPPSMRRPLRIAPRAAALLLNGPGLGVDGTPFDALHFPPFEGTDDAHFADDTVRPIADALERAPETGEWLLLMQAPRMASHELYLNRLADLAGLACLHVDASRCDLSSEAALDALVSAILAECAMYRPIVALHNADGLLFPEQQGGGASPALYALLRRLEGEARVVALCAEREWRPDRDARRAFLGFSIADALPGRRAEQWLERLGDEAALVDVDALASRFSLDTAQMDNALREARLLASMRGVPPDSRALYSACYHQVATNLHEYARLIRPFYEWDDLILADGTKSVLRDACRHMQLRDKVLRQWGFAGLLPYGQSVSMVFMGPPGTGKTMAAQVMANQLGYEIYRVDISQMVSKYVGETEKNLDRIFEEAAKVGVILFFDEADALFARRTEVKDSHDKYANMEAGFLLQRVEDYDGMIILATNHVANMDEAFIRRMRFVVRFTLPDRACRLRMWRSMLPADLPKEPIDCEFLAEQFELSGSDIKTILLHAAFHAAQEDGPLSMEHVVRSLRYHHEKINKTFLQSMLGPYAGLLRK